MITLFYSVDRPLYGFGPMPDSVQWFPETGLHPAQVVEWAKQVDEGEYATHSEHILLALQQRIKQGELSPSDLSVQFWECGKWTEVVFCEDGDMETDWPNGFFLERLELFS